MHFAYSDLAHAILIALYQPDAAGIGDLIEGDRLRTRLAG